MENDEIKIRVDQPSVTARTRPANRNSGPGPLIVVVVVVLLIVAGVLLWTGSSSTPPTQIAIPIGGNNNAADLGTPPVDEAVSTTATTLADDGQSLWSSPTNGQPIDCNYLLPGTQLLLHVRIAELLAHDEGDKVLAALGPWGEQITQQLTSATGASLSQIETLLLGIRQSRSGSLDFCVRLNLTTPVEEKSIRPDCFYPEQSADKLVVWCTPSALDELKSQQGEPPLFPRELARVIERTDGQRAATLVFSGKFLQISGEKFLRGAGEELRTAIVDFLGDEATASSLSAHWDENFFLEFRSTVVLNERPHRFAAVLEQRIAESSDRVEDAILTSSPHPYGRKVLARFPAMLRKLGNYTRAGEEDKLSLLRCYLPITAGHNLLMASELLLHRDLMSSLPAENAVVARAAAASRDLTTRLQQTTSLVFPKETLQKALEILSEELGVPIQIAGSDLQLEGITKNQSLAIDLRDRPASEVLLAVLLRANPDRTASGPTDDKQKLVYVLREAGGGQAGAIVVTTRAAAARRGEKLPDVFQPATP